MYARFACNRAGLTGAEVSRSVGAISQPNLRIFNGLLSIFLPRREFSGQTGCAHRGSLSTYIRKLP